MTEEKKPHYPIMDQMRVQLLASCRATMPKLDWLVPDGFKRSVVLLANLRKPVPSDWWIMAVAERVGGAQSVAWRRTLKLAYGSRLVMTPLVSRGEAMVQSEMGSPMSGIVLTFWRDIDRLMGELTNISVQMGDMLMGAK